MCKFWVRNRSSIYFITFFLSIIEISAVDILQMTLELESKQKNWIKKTWSL